MEQTEITFSTLGSCVTRDIFRICDIEHKFKIVKNVGFISPLSIFATIAEPLEALVESIDNSNISNFEKRNITLDLKGKAFQFLTSEKSEYLLFDLTDIRFPIMKKDTEIVTIRSHTTEAQLTKKFLMRREGYKYLWINEISKQEVKKHLDVLCKHIEENWDSDKIILIESRGTRCVKGKNGKIDKIAYFDQLYDDYFAGRTSIYNEINDYVKEKLKCHYVQIPNFQFVMGDADHTFGLHPLHYTKKIYEYLYDQICSIVFKNQYQSKKDVYLEAIKSEYYSALHVALNKNLQNPLSEELLECLSTDSCELYFEKLTKLRDILVIISVKDTAGYWFNEKMQNKMQNLGLRQNLIKKLMVGYVAIIKDGVVMYECEQPGGVVYEDVIDYYTLSVKSQSFKSGNTASICINGIDYAINKRGFNVVLLDLIRGRVIDSVAFDTHVPQLSCTRTDKYLYNEDIIRVDIKRLSNKIDLLFQVLQKQNS